MNFDKCKPFSEAILFMETVLKIMYIAGRLIVLNVE